jgi:Fe2+ transport system protein FeoA
MSASRGRAAPRSRTLGDLEPGASAIVRRVSGEPGLKRRLMELGFVPGTPVVLVRRAPMGDPIELKLRGTHFSIRGSEADRIDVDLF